MILDDTIILNGDFRDKISQMYENCIINETIMKHCDCCTCDVENCWEPKVEEQEVEAEAEEPKEEPEAEAEEPKEEAEAETEAEAKEPKEEAEAETEAETEAN